MNSAIESMLAKYNTQNNEEREQKIKAQEKILESITNQLAGSKMLTNEEVFAEIEKIIKSK